jgi:aminopeptidase-like protein
MEIAAFKVKSRNLLVLTFGHSNLNILNYRSPIDAKLMVLDSKLKEISTLQISSKKNVIWGRYEFLKMTTKFCLQTGFVNKRVQLRSEASKPTSKFLF